MQSTQGEMNSRQRFRAVMTHGRPDRVPLFEEGIRSDVINAWRDQGMPHHLTLADLFPIDNRIEIAPELLPGSELDRWQVNAGDLEKYRLSLDSDDPDRLPANWTELVTSAATAGDTLLIRVHRGLYQTLGVSGWRRFSEVNLLLMDQPRLVTEMLDIQAQFAARLLERMLAQIEVEGAIFSEPISGNSGPLVSPQMFDELIATSYEPVLQVLRRFGVSTLIFRTYANSRSLLPVIIDRGFNCLWACEVSPGAMDYAGIRREFGENLRLIGGIDTDVLREDSHKIRRELTEKVVPLLESGAFIPLADGRIRANVPYDNYVYYRNLLAEICAV